MAQQQLGFKFNPARCVGCRACSVACNQEMNTVPDTRYRRVIEKQAGIYPIPKRQFISMSCFHCDKPACLMACPVSPNKTNLNDANNCIRKDDKFGIVLIDQDKCIGCKYCIAACPYGAPQFNRMTEKVEKCTLCVHRVLDGTRQNLTGWVPACVATCIGKALEFETTSGKTGTVPGGFSAREHTVPSATFEWGWEAPW